MIFKTTIRLPFGRSHGSQEENVRANLESRSGVSLGTLDGFTESPLLDGLYTLSDIEVDSSHLPILVAGTINGDLQAASIGEIGFDAIPGAVGAGLYRLTVKVTDTQANPISNVRCVLLDTPYWGTTGTDGTCFFNLDSKSYTIRTASSISYQVPEDLTFDINGDMELNIELVAITVPMSPNVGLAFVDVYITQWGKFKPGAKVILVPTAPTPLRLPETYDVPDFWEEISDAQGRARFEVPVSEYLEELNDSGNYDLIICNKRVATIRVPSVGGNARHLEVIKSN